MTPHLEGMTSSLNENGYPRRTSDIGDVAVASLGETFSGMRVGGSGLPPGFSEQLDAPSVLPGTLGRPDGGLSALGRPRGKSIDLFLSKSPSETLGEELLAGIGASGASAGKDYVSHARSHVQGMPYSQLPSDMPAGSIGMPQKQQSFAPLGRAPVTTGERRGSSPSCSVTGTLTTASSRSGSPSAESGNTYSSSILLRQSLASKQPPNSVSSYDVCGNYIANGAPGLQTTQNVHQNVHFQTQQAPPTAPEVQIHSQHVSQPQQVFYMAMPTADGRQVLQPVQMVQLPGQQSAYVMPTQVGAPGAMPASTLQSQQVVNQGGQPVVLLPHVMQAPSVSNAHHAQSSYGKHSQIHATPYSNQQGTIGCPVPSSTPGPGDPLAALYSSPQRPPLSDLLGHIRRLSRDQVGCRLLQQAIDEEGSSAASKILTEGLSFWGEAMVDPFGNYLFQKILEKVTIEERIVLVKSVSPRLVNASLNLHGTRSVQKIVEISAADEESYNQATAYGGEDRKETSAGILTRSLDPAAARLCIDSHGNHVIQRILLKLPNHSTFIFDAIAASVGDVARHRHGCCVIQRCLDSVPCHARGHLIQCIVDKSLELMQDAYGNYVVQYVLDVCSDEDVHAVCDSVVGKVCLLSIQKFSSNVMEKCLERCTDSVRQLYLQEITEPDRIREMMMDPFGNYVVQRALAVATHAQALRLVEAMKPHLMAPAGQGQNSGGLRNTAGGRRIMAKITRRFPNIPLGEDDPISLELHQQNQQRGSHRAGTSSYHQNRSHHGHHHRGHKGQQRNENASHHYDPGHHLDRH